MALTGVTNEQIAVENVTVSDLSDSDVLIQYCLQNNVNKIAVDKLLKRGYVSLDALRLVAMEDLSSQNIPMGQQRLIFHLAQALKASDSTSGSTGNSSSTTTVTSATGGNRVPTVTSGLLIPGTTTGTALSGSSTGNTSAQGGNIGVSHSSSQPAAQQIQVGQPPVPQDIYNKPS